MRQRHAVVLSGGGADGAYEVGVVRALVSGRAAACAGGPLVPEVWTGTSIGSLNAAFLVGAVDGRPEQAVDQLEQLWLDRLARVSFLDHSDGYRFRLDPTELLDALVRGDRRMDRLRDLVGDGVFVSRMLADRALHFATTRKSLGERLIETANLSAFVSREPFRRLLEETIRFEAIRRSPAALRISATNWGNGQLRVFSNAEMTDALGPLAVMASTAIPGFFPTVEAGAERYVDGGVLMNTPLKPAIAAGADVLHVVYLDPDVRDIPIGPFDSLLDTMYRMNVIGWAARLDVDIREVRHRNRLVAQRDALRQALGLPAVRRALGASGGVLEQSVEEASAWRRLTVHRYHPHDDLGGPLGLLNVNVDRLRGLIARGEEDAAHHDCSASECVVA
jgi:NTE family protein